MQDLQNGLSRAILRGMLRIARFVLPGLVAFRLFAQQPQPTALTDSRIMALAQAGVSEAELLRMVSTAPKFEFDLQLAATDTMLKAGVSERVIQAMAAREAGAGAVVAAAVDKPVANASGANEAAQAVSEVGVYYRQSSQWIEVMPEVVNWKSGGVLKSVATVGIVKGDLNGRIRYGKSHTQLASPIQLLAYCPEGTQITEYQLIRLRTHSNSREFRTVTGGVLHVSGDSDRDDLPFTYQHVAPRTWIIPLAGLQPGEYGLLPPGAIEARSASAQLGKMYTFTVVE